MPSKQVEFSITRESLQEYLSILDIQKSIDSFLKDYSTTDALAIYYYAGDDDQIINEACSYTESFMDEYIDFINNKNVNISADEYYENYVGLSANPLTDNLFLGLKCAVSERALHECSLELDDIKK